MTNDTIAALEGRFASPDGSQYETIGITREELEAIKTLVALPQSEQKPDLRPGLEWAIARCKALQSQGFTHTRHDVLVRDFQNCIGSLSPLPT